MQNFSLLAWLYWNPTREAFSIPWINHPVVWYGILFVTGYIIGYFVFIPILAHFLNRTRHIAEIDVINWPLLAQQLQTPYQQLDAKTKLSLIGQLNDKLNSEKIDREELSQAFPGALASANRTAFFLADRLVWFAVAGTLVGARLGAVFFYDWELYKQHPEQILQVWKGGLASHGGVIGVALALYLYGLSIRKWYPQLTFLRILDFVAIPSAIAACFIRLGNFMNQEIVGTPSNLPWAVVFGNPADGSLPIPRHPVQLYEAITYLMIYFILHCIWKTKGDKLRPGYLVGLLFVLIFTSRFILEFWKNHQDAVIETSFLQMGQILSIPFILVGLFLMYRKDSEQNSS